MYIRRLFENLVISDKCKTHGRRHRPLELFENLVISDKCKTIKEYVNKEWKFENLVISDKCKTRVAVLNEGDPFENLVISYNCKTVQDNKMTVAFENIVILNKYKMLDSRVTLQIGAIT